MMELYKVSMFVFAGIAMGSFFYMKYLKNVIRNPNRKGIIGLLSIRFYDISDLLPMSIKYHEKEEKRLGRKANILLVIFYLSSALSLLISFIAGR